VIKPVTAKAPIRPAIAPPPVAAPPPPAAVQSPPVMPPAVVEDSDPGLVTIHPLTPRKVSEDDGSFNHAVTAAASYTRGIPPLRPTVGILSLAAALFALIAIWWQSVGARKWGTYRRKAQPRLMIDIPLAGEAGPNELRLPEIAFDGEKTGWDGPGSSRLGDQAAAE
jgi:hypothetical protein